MRDETFWFEVEAQCLTSGARVTAMPALRVVIEPR